MQVGSRIASRYDLTAVAGEGGMGTVYRAWDRRDRQWVALKHVPLFDAGDFVRFSREAEALASLEHATVVRYIDHGRQDAANGWLVLEWLEGQDLADRLALGRLVVEDAVQVARRVSQALAVIHARGIVHRDVKPANVWLVDDVPGSAKLLDFGVARRDATVRQATAIGVALGTPGYMAPEQIRDAANVDPTMDVFSLGVLLYEALAGVAPFQAGHALAVLARVVLDNPRPLRELRDDVSAGLADLVAAMLAKDPAHRPADGAAVLRALENPGLVDAAPAPLAVTERERRTTTLVLLHRSPSDGSSDDPLGATLPASAAEAATAEDEGLASTAGRDEAGWLLPCLAVAARHHATLYPLGPLGAVLLPQDLAYAADVAARAHALATDQRAVAPPNIRIMVVTGRTAPGGQMLFGELVARALEQLAEQPTVALGLDAATRALLRAAPSRAATPRALVGRAAELATLSALWDECCDEAVPRAALVLGPPGIGKSHLIAAFVEQSCDGEPRIWRARAENHLRQSPYFVVAELLRSAAGEMPASAWLAERVGRDEALLLGSLLGEGVEDGHAPEGVAARRDPRLLRHRVTDAWLAVVRATCDEGPFLLLLDHAQWLDPPSAALLDRALAEVGDGALLLVASGRPEAAENIGPTWREQAHRMSLAGLGKRALKRLATSLGVEEGEVSRVVELAAGNPLHLEELARAQGEGLGDTLPEGLLALVEARLDRLDSALRRVVRAASVLTPPFSLEQLAALLGEGAAFELEAQLTTLVQRAFVAPRRDGRGGFALRQDLVREAAYATLPEDDRRGAHLAAALWLEERGAADLFVLSRHLERGGEPVRAATALRSAARSAFDAGDATSTVESLRRARELDATGDPTLLLLEARALRFQGRMGEAASFLVDLLERLPVDSADWFNAAAEQATALAAVGERDALRAIGARVQAQFVTLAPAARGPCAGPAAVVVHALVSAGLDEEVEELWRTVDHELAGDALEAGIRAYLHVARAHRAIAAGRVATCRDEAQRAVAAFGLSKNRRGGCGARVVLGYAQLELGLLEAAEHTLREATDAARVGGLAMLAEAARQNLGRALERQGRFAEAVDLLAEVVGAFGAQKDARMEGCARIYLATAHHRSGQHESAEREARAALETLGAGAPFQPFAEATLARVLLAVGRTEEAVALAESARRALDRGRLEDGEAVVRLAWAQSQAAIGSAEAGAAATEAAERLRERAAWIAVESEREAFLGAIPEHVDTVRLAGSDSPADPRAK